MAYSTKRIERLRMVVRKARCDAMLVTNFTNVTYLTGFTGDDSYLFVDSREAILLTDARYTTQLHQECPGLDLEVRSPGAKMFDMVSRVVSKAKPTSLAVEGDSITVNQYETMSGFNRNTRLRSTSGLVERLREIKDKQEIDRIRNSVDTAQRAMGAIRATLRPDESEKRIAHELEHQIRLFGGSGCSFPPIVAGGARAALPHASPTNQRIGDCDFVLFDWGAFDELYASDLTRVFTTGRISPKLKRIYDVVLNAQCQAIESIRPGVCMSEVDAIARSVISDAGFGKRFGHGLGHGIGLQIHEAPRLASSENRPLRSGMVVTVEPGIYIPGWGGVRIEDDVLVTRDGHEVLSSISKDFDQCVVRL